MTSQQVISKAWELRSKLFALRNEFADLETEAYNCDSLPEDYRLSGGTAVALQRVYDRLPDLFIEAARQA